MSTPWTIRLSPEAARQLGSFPRDHQRTIGHAIDRMRQDPFQGDVQPLKGRKWHGRYRKRVGRYRLIFMPYHRERIVEISAILPRDEKTYR
jgi:mRNA-degrading endonuclease RelE of RelBE toxin-antitoxin system